MPGRIGRCIPNPTRTRDVLVEGMPALPGGRVGALRRAVHVYDRIEIPEIKPDVTQVRLQGGTCPCCASGSRPPRRRASRARRSDQTCAFAIYLRYTQAISFERCRG
jgi:hypothetical protein